MAILHEIGGINLHDAYRAILEMSQLQEAKTELYEHLFLFGADRRGHSPQAAWLAFDAIREAVPNCVCKAHQVVLAITTYRALWLKSVQPTTYKRYAPPQTPRVT